MTIWLDRVVILRGMKKQIKSFKSAFRGFCFAVKSESHMRFHLVATFYVFVFGCFYDFSAVFVCAGPVKVKNAILGIKRKDKH